MLSWLINLEILKDGLKRLEESSLILINCLLEIGKILISCLSFPLSSSTWIQKEYVWELSFSNTPNPEIQI